jgi:hypothetical protein
VLHRIQRALARRQAPRPETASPDAAAEQPATDALPTTTFLTEGASRRFVPLPVVAGSALEFSMPVGRLGERSSTTLSATTLPDTVSCGAGYLEVLYVTDDGMVVNEVRTHGDEVSIRSLEPVA